MAASRTAIPEQPHVKRPSVMTSSFSEKEKTRLTNESVHRGRTSGRIGAGDDSALLDFRETRMAFKHIYGAKIIPTNTSKDFKQWRRT